MDTIRSLSAVEAPAPLLSRVKRLLRDSFPHSLRYSGSMSSAQLGSGTFVHSIWKGEQLAGVLLRRQGQLGFLGGNLLVHWFGGFCICSEFQGQGLGKRLFAHVAGTDAFWHRRCAIFLDSSVSSHLSGLHADRATMTLLRCTIRDWPGLHDGSKTRISRRVDVISVSTHASVRELEYLIPWSVSEGIDGRRYDTGTMLLGASWSLYEPFESCELSIDNGKVFIFFRRFNSGMEILEVAVQPDHFESGVPLDGMRSAMRALGLDFARATICGKNTSPFADARPVDCEHRVLSTSEQVYRELPTDYRQTLHVSQALTF